MPLRMCPKCGDVDTIVAKHCPYCGNAFITTIQKEDWETAYNKGYRDGLKYFKTHHKKLYRGLN